MLPGFAGICGFASTGPAPVSPIDPSTLFASGEAGGFYDPSDMSSMFQDSAGTVAVTAAGQTVGRINDKSGNGKHLTTTVGTREPTLRQDANGNYYLECDDTDDSLRIAWGFSISHPLTRISALQQDAWTSGKFFYEDTNNNGLRLIQNGASPRLQMFAGGNGPFSDELAIGAPGVVTEFYNSTNSTLTINNGTPATGDTGTRSSISMEIFHAFGSGVVGRNYGFVIIGRALTAGETAGVVAFFAEKAGVTL